MDVKFWSEVAQSEAVWAICCIILVVVALVVMRKDHIKQEAMRTKREEDLRLDSKEREDKMFVHLERSNMSQERTASTLEAISHTLQVVEGRVEEVEKILYRRES